MPLSKPLILQTAQDILAKWGPEKLTMSAVGRALNVSHAALYRFFGSRDQLVEAILDEFLGQLCSRLEQIVADEVDYGFRIERVLVETHSYLRSARHEQGELFALLVDCWGSSNALKARFAQQTREILSGAIDDFLGAGDRRCAQALRVLENACFRFVDPIAIKATTMDEPETELRHVVRAVLRAFPPHVQ